MPMYMKFAKIVMLLVILTGMTGCWNRRELTELSIASAFGFDKNDGNYRVSIQLINAGEISTSKGGGGERMPVITQQQAAGKTIFESVRQLTTTTPRKVYSSHIRVLVIGEELARDGIAEVLDIISRDHELRTDFYIIVARDSTAENILSILTPLEKIPANKLFSSLEAAADSWGVTVKANLHELIHDLVSNGKQPVLAALRIKGDPNVGQSQQNLSAVSPPASLQFDGAAVFRRDVLAGWFDAEETKGFNYVVGKMKSTAVSVKCPNGGQIGIELIRTNSKIRGIVEHGKPRIEVHLTTEGNIGEVSCEMDVGSPAAIESLEELVNESIKHTIEQAVQKAKKYKSDVFGFGNVLHRTAPKTWQELRPEWDEHFAQLPIQINVKSEIRRTGSVVESFIEELGD